MRAVVQRVSRAEVRVAGEVTGRIGPGLVVLLGVGRDDTESEAAWMLDKIAGLRIFADEAGKMNLCLEDIRGGLLVVSQFTLAGSLARGRRPARSTSTCICTPIRRACPSRPRKGRAWANASPRA